jgi:hypothetical protein
MWLKNKNIRIRNKNMRCANQTWKNIFIFIMLTYAKNWRKWGVLLFFIPLWGLSSRKLPKPKKLASSFAWFCFQISSSQIYPPMIWQWKSCPICFFMGSYYLCTNFMHLKHPLNSCDDHTTKIHSKMIFNLHEDVDKKNCMI